MSPNTPLDTQPERVRRYSLFLHNLWNLRRRQGWFLENLTLRKAWNLLLAGLSFVLRTERAWGVPVIAKIDISPACNLKCTVCVHAEAEGREALAEQSFGGSKAMTIERFREIIDELSGRACAVSLYFLGDPYAHPKVDEMCRIARDAGLNVHLNSNYSFNFSDARIRRIVESGVTHLTACVDGLSQEKYELTRVGGKIERVLDNLKRTCEVRRELGSEYPRIEVQYVKFQHNADEVEAARELCTGWGIDTFTDFWGALHNYTDLDTDQYEVLGPKKPKFLPLCGWTHFATLIKYDGSVVPCCQHRLGDQYRPGADARPLGNVFETSLEEVWRSQPYREARRLVSRPAAADAEPDLQQNFCHACPFLYRTDVAKNHRWANQHTWEETIGQRRKEVAAAEVTSG